MSFIFGGGRKKSKESDPTGQHGEVTVKKDPYVIDFDTIPEDVQQAMLRLINGITKQNFSIENKQFVLDGQPVDNSQMRESFKKYAHSTELGQLDDAGIHAVSEIAKLVRQTWTYIPKGYQDNGNPGWDVVEIGSFIRLDLLEYILPDALAGR
jgi:hypothetical protein